MEFELFLGFALFPVSTATPPSHPIGLTGEAVSKSPRLPRGDRTRRASRWAVAVKEFAINLLDYLHEDFVHNRRTRVLSDMMVRLLPKNGHVLDLGCGDGLISKCIQEKRKDVTIEGIDVLLRAKVHIPVKPFDGKHLPYADNSFDAVMFIDVLHHTDDPVVLIREATRVSRNLVLIKDHTRDGFLAGPTLLFMDRMGNARHGVSISANYWTEKRWRKTFAELSLTVNYWTAHVPLYPWWVSWIFDRSLHFIASLTQRTPDP